MSAWTQVCPSRPPLLVSLCIPFLVQAEALGFQPIGGGESRLQGALDGWAKWMPCARGWKESC